MYDCTTTELPSWKSVPQLDESVRFLARFVRYVLQNVTFAEHDASRTCVMLTSDFSASKKDVEPCGLWVNNRVIRLFPRLQSLPAITARMDNTA
jgi:hypothetical protein